VRIRKTTRRKLLATCGGAAFFSDAVSFGRRKDDLEAEIASHANHYLRQKYLVVDCYRIRRRVAYPLPVPSLSVPAIPVPGISDYPWATWMLWELEDRVASLRWAAEWRSQNDCIQAVTRDLEAISEWPQHCQYAQPRPQFGERGPDTLGRTHAVAMAGCATAGGRCVQPARVRE
jgi:hypothetical protein